MVNELDHPCNTCGMVYPLIVYARVGGKFVYVCRACRAKRPSSQRAKNRNRATSTLRLCQCGAAKSPGQPQCVACMEDHALRRKLAKATVAGFEALKNELAGTKAMYEKLVKDLREELGAYQFRLRGLTYSEAGRLEYLECRQQVFDQLDALKRISVRVTYLTGYTLNEIAEMSEDQCTNIGLRIADRRAQGV